MISNRLMAAAFLLTVGGAGAIAAPPDGQAVAETASATTAVQVAAETDTTAQDEKKICHTEKVTGSLSRRSRVCLTAAQWREVYDRTRRGVGDMQNSASGAPACISAMDVACGAPGPGGAPGM